MKLLIKLFLFSFPETAEEIYISQCQDLNGYGHETFYAKNKRHEDVTVAISVAGILLAPAGKFYYWRDISNVVNHKRMFKIECNVEKDSEEFTFRDGVTGQYVWRLCVSQHKFYQKYIQKGINQPPTEAANGNQLFHNVEITASRDDLDQSNWNVSDVSGNTTTTSSHMTAPNNWPPPTTPDNAPLYANSGVPHSLSSSSWQQSSTANVSHVDYANGNVVGSNWGIHPAGSSASLNNRAQSSSCLDLSNNNLVHDRDRLKAMLPRYRPAPDYDTALQQKLRANSQEINLMHQLLPNHLQLSAQMLTAGSQPDMHRFTDIGYMTAQQPYPDVTRHENQPATLLTPNYSDASEYGLTQRFKMMRLVAHPPTYAVNRYSSTSTPDLHRALLGIRNGYGSSPDLVSSRTIMSNMIPEHVVRNAYAQQMRHSQNILPHGTYENLNTMHKIYEQDAAANLQLFHYAQGPPPPPPVESILVHPAAEPRQLPPKSSLTGSIEPIYENIPLPWPPQQQTMDDAAASAKLVAKPVPSTRKEMTPATSSYKPPVLAKTTSNPLQSVAAIQTAASPQEFQVRKSSKKIEKFIFWE